jgi:hypothetical protein
MIIQLTIIQDLCEMYGIMLINQAGEAVASAGWEHLEGDVSMFGGFVSAVQMFIKKISGGNEVEELRFGDMKLLIGSTEDYHVVTLHEINELDAKGENIEATKIVSENGSNFLDNGIIGLIKEMVTRDRIANEKVKQSVKDWTQSQVEKAKKSASDWGKTVF